MKEKNYITPKGLKKLEDELDSLVRVERPIVTSTVAWAASNGDRSENADYIYGKKRLREIDRRVRFLNQRIDLAICVDPTKALHLTKIQFGASVTLLDMESVLLDKKTISIVGVNEINTEKGLLSWRSPIGNALIGKIVGDTIEIQTPKGLREFQVLEVVYREID